MARFSRRQFSGTNGEVSPRLHMRADMDFYYASYPELVNWVPDHKGNTERRPPTRFLRESKNGQKPCLYPLKAGIGCCVIVEAYPDCFRFIINREVLLTDTGEPYEVAHGYGADHCNLEFTQDCGAMFIAHENHPKQILEKQGTDFTLTTINTFPFDDLNSDKDCELCLEAGGGEATGTEGFISTRNLAVGDTVTLTSDEGVTSFAASVNSYNGNGISAVTFPTGVETGVYDVLNGTLVDGQVSLSVNRALLRARGCAPFTAGMVGKQIRILDESGVCETNASVNGFSAAYKQVVPGTGDYRRETYIEERSDTEKTRYVLDPGNGDFDKVSGGVTGPGGGSLFGSSGSEEKNDPNTWITVTVTEFVDGSTVYVDYGGCELKCTDLFQLPAFSDGIYPETIAIFQDRLWCAKDDGVVGSKTGDFFEWEPSDPDGTVNPDNAVYKKVRNGNCDDVRWMWPMGRHLLIGTGDSLYSLIGSGVNGAFAADGVSQQLNERIGVADARPLTVGDGVFFIDSTRTKLYGLAFIGQYEQIQAQDYTLFADHIGDRKIKKIAYQRNPYSIVWGICDDGTLFSLTVVPNQNVRGWARHQLGGRLIKDGCEAAPEVCDIEAMCGPDESTDDIYMVVRRTIKGQDRYYIEVLGEFFNEETLHLERGYLDSHLTLQNITNSDNVSIGGPEPFPLPSGVSGAFALADSDGWYFFDDVGGQAKPRAPNTYDEPIHGRDWVNDEQGWRKTAKPKYCQEPEFLSERLHVYRPPCGANRIAPCFSQVSGLAHLSGEDVLAFADGQMHEETISEDGDLDISGCLVTAGLPYDSTLSLLPFRQALGTTDGACDPQRTVGLCVNVYKSFWLESGTGKRDEYYTQAAQWDRIEFDGQDVDVPELFTGWASSPHFMNINNNSESGVSIRARGPWPATIRSIETIIEASGGR